MTISYNPTDTGARRNYPDLLEEYNNGKSLSATSIYEILYDFKKETYWRDNYDLLFEQVGIESDFIAHMDMSFFPYKSFRDYLNNKSIDDSYKFLLKVIEMLGNQIEYIFVDGAKNFDIIALLKKDYVLIDSTVLPINKGKPHKLLIYKHKALQTKLIYYGCFLYGQACPKRVYVEKLGKYIKEHTI